MKILSVRRGFTSDHSSTSYEFLAIDKPLTREQRAAVARLSRRADPTARTVSFMYNVDGYDIPGGWETLMVNYYDIMYSESYDLWTLAMAFNAPEDQRKELEQYDFYGAEDMGVHVQSYDSRAVVTINCMFDYNVMPDIGDYEEYDEEDEEYEDEDEENEEEGEELPPQPVVVTGNNLLDLLACIRQQLIDRDYRALYAVWEEYGLSEEDLDLEEDEEYHAPPEPPAKKTGGEVAETLRRMLTTP